MTGKEFESLMTKAGFNRTSLAEHWNMTRQTIGNYCKAERVENVYADAIKVLFYENKMSSLSGIVHEINETKEIS